MNRGRTYIIYFEWANTASNHAGMAYLFRKLKEFNKENIHLIRIPSSINDRNRYLQKTYSYLLVFFLKLMTSNKDKVLFVEYLGNRSGNQTGIAQKLRKYKVKTKLFGIVHLSESHLLELYENDNYIKESSTYLDKVIVLGSSLQDYFVRLGFLEKVICTYHYVDTSYYKPAKLKTENKRLRIIAMGSLKRNHNDLKEIIVASPNVDFDVCMGNAKLEAIFIGLNNVTLHGFLAEDKLLQLMQNADISISVLDDTIGSNVITTSLACGLPQIVSNVGSIKDYCDSSNTILCNNTLDFVIGIEKLRKDVELRTKMSKSAFLKSLKLDLSVFNNWFKNNILIR